MMDTEAARTEKDLDLLWYLWSGPHSPLFGKDQITTLERDLIADKATHHETKNAYFSLIHEPWFCEKILAEFGADPATGLIVNGHVPVKIEKGENPLKRSGKAITIDGAFSEAYGDHGYTLVLEPGRIALAEHSHFDSVEAAMREGADIIPKVTTVRAVGQAAPCRGRPAGERNPRDHPAAGAAARSVSRKRPAAARGVIALAPVVPRITPPAFLPNRHPDARAAWEWSGVGRPRVGRALPAAFAPTTGIRTQGIGGQCPPYTDRTLSAGSCTRYCEGFRGWETLRPTEIPRRTSG